MCVCLCSCVFACVCVCVCVQLSVYICVLQGIFSGRGRQLLFADADGASKFSDFDKLEAELSKIKTEVHVCFGRHCAAICHQYW